MKTIDIDLDKYWEASLMHTGECLLIYKPTGTTSLLSSTGIAKLTDLVNSAASGDASICETCEKFGLCGCKRIFACGGYTKKKYEGQQACVYTGCPYWTPCGRCGLESK